MGNKLPLSPFEEEIQQILSFAEPQEEFHQSLHNQLVKKQPSIQPKRPGKLFLKPVVITLMIAVIILAGSLFYYGPDIVYAAISRLFGYIPGIGLVDQSTLIRTLAEPVSQEREGITITVNQAILTAEKTEIDFGVSGIPLSAYHAGEISTEGCMQREYLRLPDGSQLGASAPLPLDINEAVLVIPCLFNTLPNTVPTDWELPLKFIPLPKDVTIIPVQESDPGEMPTLLSTTNEPESTAHPADPAIRIEKTIQTEEGYILIGSIAIDPNQDGWTQITGIPQITDANNVNIKYDLPTDIQAYPENSNSLPWIMQFDAADVTFPVTLDFSGERYEKITANAPVHLAFDAGEDPQYGQEWDFSRDFSLAGYQFQLETIRAGRNGYSFTINTSLNEVSVTTPPSVEISGYQALGAGGGSSGMSLVFSEIPKGNLDLIFSSFYILSEHLTWTTQWQPEEIRTDWPTPTPPSSDTCVNEDNFEKLSALPAAITGLIIRTELNPETNLASTDLNGDQRKVFGSGRNRGALSPDGSQIAYADEDGMHLVKLFNGVETVLTGLGSHELSWSPDSSRIALVNPHDSYGIFITNLYDQQLTQVSNLGYETIAGWSPDGKKIFYAIPGSSQDGSQLKAFDLVNEETTELFILKDSSLKAPAARISPNGAWIAYRSRDYSKVYLISIDGKENRPVLSLPDDQYSINALQWDTNSGLLGISVTGVSKATGQSSRLYLIDILNCSSYLINNFNGELNGLWID